MKDMQCIAPSVWPLTQFLGIYPQLGALHFIVTKYMGLSAVNGLRTVRPRERPMAFR